MRAVGFDADGVLIASREAAWLAAERILASFGTDVSITSPQAMEAAFGHPAQHALVGQEHAATLRMMHRLIMRGQASRLALFEPVMTVIAGLPARRILVTAALSDGVAACLGAAAGLFEDIQGFERGVKPDLLARLADEVGVYVTDTAGDVRICQGLGIPVIGCAWGSYDDRAALEAARPDIVVDTAAELSAALNPFIT